MKKLPKKMLIIIAVAILVLGGAGGFFMMKKSASGKATLAKPGVDKEIAADATKEEAAPEGKATEAKEGEAKAGEGKEGEGKEGEKKTAPPSKAELSYQLKMTVNLLDPRSRWFIKVTIEVQTASAKAKATMDENDAPLRDATITLLSSKTREEVSTPEGTERLKRELRARFEGILPPHTFEDIYITEKNVISQ